MANEDIKQAKKNANLTNWQIADFLNISEMTFCRMMRKEMSQEDKDKILNVIEENKTI